MKVYYNVLLQMFGTYEIEDRILEEAARQLGFNRNDIEEIDTHCASIMFVSTVKPTEMRDRIGSLLVNNQPIYYADVMYRFEQAMVPDRFVRWRDGRYKEFTGSITWIEDQ